MNNDHKEIRDAFLAYLNDYFSNRDYPRTIAHFGKDIIGFGSSKDENTYTYARCKEAFKRDIEAAPEPIHYEIRDLIIKTPKPGVGLLSCELDIETKIHDQTLRFNHLRYTLAFTKHDKRWYIQHKHLSLPSRENDDDEPYPIKELEKRNIALKRMVDEKTEELNASLEKIKVLANSDFLTGIDNRLKIDETLNVLIEQAKKEDRTFSVVLIDIDKFKKINDVYGHLTGDEVIIKTAAFIRDMHKTCISVGRWGGDEFILVFEDKAIDETRLIAEELRETYEQQRFLEDRIITISLGLSQYQKGDTIETIIARCDRAMYEAKKSGRNRVRSAWGKV